MHVYFGSRKRNRDLAIAHFVERGLDEKTYPFPQDVIVLREFHERCAICHFETLHINGVCTRCQTEAVQ